MSVDRRVLVIDDEAIVRTSCRRVLEPEGYAVVMAENGPDGLRRIRDEGPFSLVLTDLKMPGMDGIEVLRRIKDGWPDIPVVIVTGYQTIETAVKAIKLGAFDYVNKPFTPDALLDVVARALQGEA